MVKYVSKESIKELSYSVIGAAIYVHAYTGPGLIESVYEAMLCEELKYRKIEYCKQQIIPIYYRDKVIDAQHRYDVLVENLIILELKAVRDLHPIHEAILLSYMKLLQKPKGLLINFCSTTIRSGLKS